MNQQERIQARRQASINRTSRIGKKDHFGKRVGIGVRGTLSPESQKNFADLHSSKYGGKRVKGLKGSKKYAALLKNAIAEKDKYAVRKYSAMLNASRGSSDPLAKSNRAGTWNSKGIRELKDSRGKRLRAGRPKRNPMYRG